MSYTPWPAQTRAITQTLAALKDGERRVLLTLPTGGGKTFVAACLIEEWLSWHEPTILYTNRKLMVRQLSEVMETAGLKHGIRAAGLGRGRGEQLQIASIQTEQSRTLRREKTTLFKARHVLIDEAHLMTSPAVRKLLTAHLAQGADYVGLTATPLGCGSMYDKLIVAGTNSELRECGALVHCTHYGPDEPDMTKLQPVASIEDVSEEKARKVMMRPGLHGRVLEWFDRLNPTRRPTILFAPGVPESLGFAQEFVANGIPAAHIDGQNVWINGRLYDSTEESRAEALAASRDGSIVVLCNRFVLREGIDAPWLAHCIFATVFGSLQSYLQSGGRLLRSHPSLVGRGVTLQDHGGNWWRFGSLNEDRQWKLEWTAPMLASMRTERLRAQRCASCQGAVRDGACVVCGEAFTPEPKRCPQCAAIMLFYKCVACGARIDKAAPVSRPVVQEDGTLIDLGGAIFKPKRIIERKDTRKKWERMYWRAHRSKNGMTFIQALNLFALENYHHPPRTLPLMPRQPEFFYSRVRDVPKEELL